MNLSSALGTLASASAAPYGYTISVWSSDAVLIHFRSAPNVGDVVLFAAGALAAFTLIGLLAHGYLCESPGALFFWPGTRLARRPIGSTPA